MIAAGWTMAINLGPAPTVEVTWNRIDVKAGSTAVCRLRFENRAAGNKVVAHPHIRRTTLIDFNVVAAAAHMLAATTTTEITRRAVAQWKKEGGLERSLLANPNLLKEFAQFLSDRISNADGVAPGSAASVAPTPERLKPAGAGTPTGFISGQPATREPQAVDLDNPQPTHSPTEEAMRGQQADQPIPRNRIR
jgi:hypothetical protein